MRTKINAFYEIFVEAVLNSHIIKENHEAFYDFIKKNELSSKSIDDIVLLKLDVTSYQMVQSDLSLRLGIDIESKKICKVSIRIFKDLKYLL